MWYASRFAKDDHVWVQKLSQQDRDQSYLFLLDMKPKRDVMQIKMQCEGILLYLEKKLFKNMDLISHLSGSDRCDIQVQIPRPLCQTSEKLEEEKSAFETRCGDLFGLATDHHEKTFLLFKGESKPWSIWPNYLSIWLGHDALKDLCLNLDLISHLSGSDECEIQVWMS